MSHHPAPGVVDDEGEAFARAVFGRFLRQATICRDIDDAIEHMHIVNDNSRTFDIRLGGEARVPVSRELILALASKKKELLGLCESALRMSNVRASTGTGASGSGSSLHQQANAAQAVVFPPPNALAAMQSVAGSAALPVGRGGGPVGDGVATAAPAVVRPAEATGGIGGAARAEERMPVVGAEPTPSPKLSAYVPANRPPGSLVRVGESSGPTTVFVRKVDMKIERDDLVKHFSAFGDVVALSMNPTRGYAFVDYPSHDCVLRAVSAPDHVVGHRTLVVEAKKELPNNTLQRVSLARSLVRLAGW